MNRTKNDNKSKVITIKYSDEIHDCFHYRVETWKEGIRNKRKKLLMGWPGINREDAHSAYEITDISDLSLYEFHRLYQQLALHGHLLDLEQTVCNQRPIFADDDWKLAILMGKIEKE